MIEFKDGRELTFIRMRGEEETVVGLDHCDSIALQSAKLPSGDEITVAVVKTRDGHEYYMNIANAEEFG